MNNKQKKDLARQLFIYDDMPQKEIATYIATSENTISKWKQEEKWEDIKSAKSVTKEEIIRNYYHLILESQKIIKDDKRMPTASEVDAQHKMASSIEKLSGNKIVLPQIIAVFKEYDKWLVQIDPELAKRNSEFQKKFIQMKATSE